MRENNRLYLIIGLFYSIFLLLIGRLAYLQILKYDFFLKKARSQQEKYLVEKGRRGWIFDRYGRVLGLMKYSYSVYANPRLVENPLEFAKEIAPLLDLDKNYIIQRLRMRDRYFVWLRRRVEDKLIEKLKNKSIKAMGIRKEYKRIYPNGSLAAHVLGAVDIDNNGIAGIEAYYDDVLKGSSGYRMALKDGRSKIIAFSFDYLSPRDGRHLVLTIDEVIQHIVEKKADYLMLEYKPKHVSIVVLNPFTGELLALANRPCYDPNKITQDDIPFMRNYAISDIFEPGSVLKIVTAAALLEENLVSLEEKIYCEKGQYLLNGRMIHDWHPFGWLKFSQIIYNSSNIGVAKLAQRIPAAKFYEYLKKFGFGVKTGIDLPGEEDGLLRPLNEWSHYSLTSLAIGHEIAVTTMQLAQAMAVIANGGLLVRPHVLKEIRTPEGAVLMKVPPEIKTRVISTATAKTLQKILVEVVEFGTGRKAKLANYRVAGKTGTAQKFDFAKRRYSRNKFVSSFVGFAPYPDPQFVIAITVDEPKQVYYGGQVCAPQFKEIAKDIISYLKIKPFLKEDIIHYVAQASFNGN